jgi:hypothetical protein
MSHSWSSFDTHWTHFSRKHFSGQNINNKICLTQLDYMNKITYKTLPKLGKFNQFIQPFKHGHDTKEPQHYFPSHKTILNYGQLSW